jgi:hypothetical protein
LLGPALRAALYGVETAGGLLRPEALDALDPAERRKVYSVLGLRVEALPDGDLS